MTSTDENLSVILSALLNNPLISPPSLTSTFSILLFNSNGWQRKANHVINLTKQITPTLSIITETHISSSSNIQLPPGALATTYRKAKRGVMILPQASIPLTNKITHPSSRIISTTIKLDSTNITLIGVYAPASRGKLPEFCKTLTKFIEENELVPPFIISGDFNSSAETPHQSIRALCEILELTLITPNQPTFRMRGRESTSKIDYVLVSNSIALSMKITNQTFHTPEIDGTPLSDHFPILFQFKSPSTAPERTLLPPPYFQARKLPNQSNKHG